MQFTKFVFIATNGASKIPAFVVVNQHNEIIFVEPVDPIHKATMKALYVVFEQQARCALAQGALLKL